MSDSNPQAGVGPESAGERGGKLSRRALIRAGLSVAPVLASLKTDMVLAGTTGTVLRPSAFSSFVANGQRCSVKPGKPSQMGSCLTHAQCKTMVTTSTCYFGTKYHNNTEGISGCGFAKPAKLLTGCSTLNPKLSWVVSSLTPSNDDDRLAQYCALGYMSAKYYGDSTSYITAQMCRNIWTNRANATVCTVGGVARNKAWVLSYFSNVYSTTSNFGNCV